MKTNESENTQNFIEYPLLFFPIYKDRIWGGNRLKSLNKNLPNDHIGESWELSPIEGDVSVVSNGVYKNWSLNKLIQQFPKEILGQDIIDKFGNNFPLLFKFLDAKTDLSVQLHPNDTLAAKRHNTSGKTEMWYVMHAEDNAKIILGFDKNISPEEYVEHLNNKTLTTVLREIPVKKGDVFYIKTGTVHAIGGGILLAEIQQPSDITYRIYDWDRVDDFGNPRELHIDWALEAIDYNSCGEKIHYLEEVNQTNLLVKSPFFTTNYIPLSGSIKIKNDKPHFLIYICTEGKAVIHFNTTSILFNEGDVVLIPAQLKNLEITGNSKILEVYINS